MAEYYEKDIKKMVKKNLESGLAYVQLKPMKASLAKVAYEKLAGTKIGGVHHKPQTMIDVCCMKAVEYIVNFIQMIFGEFFVHVNLDLPEEEPEVLLEDGTPVKKRRSKERP